MVTAVITITDMSKRNTVEHRSQIANIPKILKCNMNTKRSSSVDYSVKPGIPDIVDGVCVIRQMDNDCRYMMFMAVIYTF